MPEFVVSLGNVSSEDRLLGLYTKININEDREIPALRTIRSSHERERLIVSDLLYVLNGDEGDYIRYDRTLDVENAFQRLEGIPYTIDSSLEINLKEIAKDLANLGTMVYSLRCASVYFSKTCYGKVAGKLCAYIRTSLKEYGMFLCTLNKDSLSLISLSHMIHKNVSDQGFGSWYECIFRLYTVIQLLIKEDRKRFQNNNYTDMRFENIMKSIKEDNFLNQLDEVILDSQNYKHVKGGVMLNILHEEILKHKGNLKSFKHLQNVYDFISADYISILNNWLRTGTVLDFLDEFFIIEDRSTSSLKSSYYWTNKFAIRSDGLPTPFKDPESQRKIYLTGKYLAILKHIGCDNLAAEEPFDPVTSFNDVGLNVLINDAYNRSNDLFVKVLRECYQLPEFIGLLNRYFLLSDGSVFDDFLSRCNHELKRSFRNASTVEIIKTYYDSYYTENQTIVERLFTELLTVNFQKLSILEDILGIIRTQITNVDDILKAPNLGSLTEILNANVNSKGVPGSSGRESEVETQRCNKLTISRFCLEIDIPFPLNQIITDPQKLEYQILFRHSALLKFIEKRMEKSWRELGYHAFWTWNYQDRRVQKWIKKCRFIHTKMFDFLRIYSFYLKHDVLEYNSGNIHSMIDDSNEKLPVSHRFDLTTYKTQMTEFLSSSMGDALISREDLATCLYEMFTLIIVFHEYVMSLRKALLLMDETLLNSQKERLKLSINFSKLEKEKRMKTVVKVLDAYHVTFQEKLLQLCQYLAYYGEIDSPKLLQFHGKLISSFKL